MVDVSQLNEPAKSAAERALKHGLTLTSGHRSVDDQAHAMAVNAHNDRHYLRIYASQAVKECQEWVEKWLEEHHSENVDIEECKAYLLEALNGKWHEVSWHLTGDAFDCSPHGTDEQKALLEKMVADINASGGEAKFLDSEHGDPAWHVQCRGGTLPEEHDAAAHDSSEPASGSAGRDYPGHTLHRGSHGDEVKAWQERLAELGHPPGVADGDFGPETEAATKHFQQAKGLQEDGIVGDHTWAAAWQ